MRRLSLLPLLLVCALVAGQPNERGATQFAAQQVRLLIAGYISQFPFYVEWPEEVFAKHPGELWIGLVGDDPLGSDGRDYLARRSFAGRKLVLRRIDKGKGHEDLEQFQILYFGSTEDKELKSILKAVKGKPVLTCGISPNFLSDGGMVQFQVVGLAVSFNVQTTTAQNAGLKIDPLFITYGMIM